MSVRVVATMRWVIGAAFGVALLGPVGAATPPSAAPLQSCRLKGVPTQALCGRIERPLDPARVDGQRIEIHFAIVPALARNKLPDPLFFFAGGPGQSAIELAGPLAAQMARFSNRRDLVFIDQRGTGRSAPLACDDQADALRPLAERFDLAAQQRRLAACRLRLQQLPHGDLRQYTTTIAMADVEAVRRALGAPQVNLIGASYGTRAALEYLRLHPSAVRRVVLDGVAPADMALPQAFSVDNQSAFDALLADCARESACAAGQPELAARWRELVSSLPREYAVAHPVTGRAERLVVDRHMLLGMVRSALYVPTVAAGLPRAIAEAAAGNLTALIGLSSALGGGSSRLYAGMHFSVVCAEDEPRRLHATDPPGADFGVAFARLYEQICADWPRGAIEPAFYNLPPAPVPTLLLSGGDDPATPPRHGARVARALGPKARHAVVAHGGHGLMSLPCLRDAVFRFVDAPTEAAAAAVAIDCAAGVPRPPAFTPVGAKAASR